MVIALDAGRPDDQSSFGARNDIHRIARVQQPQHAMQFDLGRMQTDDLAANTAQPWPIALGAHTAAIHDDSGIGELAIRDECFPVALNLVLAESYGDSLQQCAIVYLRFTSDIKRSGKSRRQGRFQFIKFSTCDVFEVSLRVSRGEHSLDANCLPGILAVPEQEGSVVAIENRGRQFSQPLRPH